MIWVTILVIGVIDILTKSPEPPSRKFEGKAVRPQSDIPLAPALNTQRDLYETHGSRSTMSCHMSHSQYFPGEA